jgi:protein involved in polysaccharide export with SLBB domain
MTFKTKTIRISGLVLLGLYCLGCIKSMEAIPVREYRKQKDIIEPPPRSEEMLQEIRKFSRVTKNQVFTEEWGIPEYIIGPCDVLEVTFWEANQPVKYETAVRSDGCISYSFLDDIKVSGMTRRQVDQVLTQGLSKYIKNVRIDVVVLKHKSKSALLFGEINILQTGRSGPGKYELQGKTRILDLIVMAGGATKNSDLKNVELVREVKRYGLNLYDAMFKGDMTQNVIIDNGDVVTVPELPELGERVYVFGEVNNEGIFAHEEAYDLLAALLRAGGCTRTAVEDDIKIIRGYGNGKPVILSASLNDVLKKGDISQNIHLLDGDVVYVPRTLIGDINEFIVKTTPLLDYLFYPARYRDSYSDTDRIRYLMSK